MSFFLVSFVAVGLGRLVRQAGSVSMKRLVWAALLLLLLAGISRAQETPQAEIAVGYSHFHIVKGFTIPMEGGSGSLAVNATDWLGVIGDFGAYDSHGLGFNAQTYTFGPRFYYRKLDRRFAPFAQALVGGAHFSAPFGGAPDAKGNHFAYSFGVGADIGLGRSGKVALRPQADYFGVQFSGQQIGNIRLSIGVVFRFGKRQ